MLGKTGGAAAGPARAARPGVVAVDIVLLDWLSLLLRWAHLIVGIAWIGSSFYFIWLDLSLRKEGELPPGVGGETWMVHGGGFYLARKYLVAPEALPEELHWFKYEAYFTWITGILLLALIYYWGAESFLIDPSVMALAPWQAIAISLAALALGWLLYDLLCKSPLGRNTALLALLVFVFSVAAAYGLAQVFSGRAAFIHVGAILGTIMAGNVFFVIIPNQKKTVAALLAGEAPDPALGLQAKQRSTHNNYLTLPVLLMMISNHYPMTFGHDQSWVVVAGVILVGAAVRHFFNVRNAGGRGAAIAWQIPVAAALTVALVAFTAWRPGGEGDEAAAVDGTTAFAIVQAHCVSCHAAEPSSEDFDEPPGGVMFDSPAQLRAQAARVLAQAVLSEAMPLGNMTGMTEEERRQLGNWIRAGAPE